MVTQKQIAEAVGMARSTVSTVLNNVYSKSGGRISEEKRTYIKKVAREMGYAVDDMARSIRTGKDKVIGYVCYDLADDPVIPCVTAEMAKSDYTLCMFNFNEKLIENCLKRRISGIIFHMSSADIKPYISKLRDTSIKVAVIGTSHTESDFIHVDTDNRFGTLQGMEHLYNLGHRQIVFAGHYGSKSAAERYAAYEKFMFSKKLKPQKVILANHNFKASEEAFTELLSKTKPVPTAFFCSSSTVAGVLFYIAAKNNLRIPDDISIVGFGQNVFKDYLTHIDEQYDKMAGMVIEALINSIEHEIPKELNEKLKTRLVVGDSTAKILKT